MRFKSRLGYFLSPRFFDVRGRKPNGFGLLLRFIVLKAISTVVRNSEISSEPWARFIQGFATFPDEVNLGEIEQLPSIEVLVVAAGKDFDVLPFCLKNAQNGSRNPISKYIVVTPSSDIDEAIILCTGLSTSLGVKIQVIDEDHIFDKKFRDALRTTYKSRYGWVLQQLLTTEMVLRSDSQGVLVIDSDTVLLQPRSWVNLAGQQCLLVSREFHWSYYKFLNSLGLCDLRPKHTYVTHHMLMQPTVMRSIFELLGLSGTQELAHLAMQAQGLDAGSPVCLEFELYGQGITKFFPGKASFVKFSNAGVPRKSGNTIETLVNRARRANKYFSISLHTYL